MMAVAVSSGHPRANPSADVFSKYDAVVHGKASSTNRSGREVADAEATNPVPTIRKRKEHLMFKRELADAAVSSAVWCELDLVYGTFGAGGLRYTSSMLRVHRMLAVDSA